MPIKMLDAVDFTKVPSLQFVVPMVASDPAAYEAGLIYNSTDKKLKFHNGTAWVEVGSASGAAGGDLSGNYPNPQIAAGAIVDADVNATANIAQSKIAGLVAALGGKVDTVRQVIAGSGLTGGGPLSGDITINAVQGPGILITADQIAADTVYLDGRYINAAGDTMAGDLAFSGYKVTGLISSGVLADTDAAPVWYVEQRASGMDVHTEVKAATTAKIATLSGLLVVDGYQTVAGDRVLVRWQHEGSVTPGLASGNGIFTVAAGAWTRVADADGTGELKPGSVVAVLNGSTYANVAMSCQIRETQVPWVPGTGDNYWAILTSRLVIQGGAGLVLTGGRLDIVAGDSTLTVNPDNVVVASAPKWTTARTLSLTGDVTGSVSLDGSANASIATTVTGGSNLAKHFAGDVPAGTSCVITHNLNTQDVNVQVYRKSAPFDTVLCDVQRTTVNTVTLVFAAAVTAAQYRCVVQGR